MNYISYSQLRVLDGCPRKWYLTYGPEGVRPLPTQEMQAGRNAHEQIAAWLRERVGAAPSSIALYQHMLGEVVHVEQELTMPVIQGVQMRAIPDVYWVEGPKAYIIDWKSGTIPPDDEQLKFYAAAVMYTHAEVEEVVARYCVYGTAKPVYCTYVYTGAELMEFYASLKAKAAELASKELVPDAFPMHPTRACAACAFAMTCAKELGAGGGIEPADIERLIGVYHVSQAAADQAHDMIREWMIERGLSRIVAGTGEGFELRPSMSMYKTKSK